MKGREKVWAIICCLALTMVLTLGIFSRAAAPVRYRLGAGDAIDFTAVTKTNQGTGSGLDADLLDGKDSSDFVASGAGGIKDTDIDWGLNPGQVNTDDVPEGTANKYFSGKGFTDLADTPSSYTGQGGKVVSVKTTEDGLEFSTSAGGEANTASNVGTAGVGIFKQKTGVDLEFKKLNADSANIIITDDTINDEVDIDIAGSIDAIARTTVRKNTGTDVGSRRRLNFIEGSGVSLTIADDATDEEVDITIASSGGGGGGGFDSRISVKRTTRQTIPHGTFTKVQLNVEEYDNLNEFDNTTNYVFTAQAAGGYLVIGWADWAFVTGGDRMVCIRVNDSAMTPRISSFHNYYTYEQQAVGILNLAANDTVSLWVFQSSGGAINLENARLMICRLW